MKLKNFTLILFVVLIFIVDGFSQTPSNYQTAPTYTVVPSYTDQELQVRLQTLSALAVKPKLDAIVKSYVKTYSMRRRDKTEKMLGKMVMYFPIFEKYLLENNMPLDIKYLSVVESALNPVAVSSAGAQGLWQFMPVTGGEYGLEINVNVDERRDPHESTKAAIAYLKRLHNKYQDWELALAAYNSGPGRVNRAIRRGRSKDFWKIKKYLPKETRNYVPAFVAANYIVNFYKHHNLTPQYPSIEMQLTASTKVYQTLSFREISDISGTPIHIVEALNPGYKTGTIPARSTGRYLTLPKHTMSKFLTAFARPDSQVQFASNVQQRYFQSVYYVQHGDNLNHIANLFDCHPRHLMAWNNLVQPMVTPGQELTVYQLGSNIVPPPVKKIPVTEPSQVKTEKKEEPILKEATVLGLKNKKPNNTHAKKDTRKSIFKKKKYQYHFIQRNESLIDIADKYPGVTVTDIIKLNKIKKNSLPSIGDKIRVKKI